MASADDEIGGSSNVKVYQTNELFPKIDNLEYFPENVLMHIFSYANDVSLLHLAKISNRFASIAQLAFNGRYANEYFHDMPHEDGEFEATINQFGSGVNAIRTGGVGNIQSSYWLMRYSSAHSDRIRKFIFYFCIEFNLHEVLSKNSNATHITLDFCHPPVYSSPHYARRTFPDLIHFEINCSHALEQQDYIDIIRNAPQLETFIVHNFWPYVNHSFVIKRPIGASNILENVNQMLNTVRKLHVLDEFEIGQVNLQGTMDKLESLKLAVGESDIDLLRQFRSLSPNLKELILVLKNDDELTDRMIAAIRSFSQIDTLSLRLDFVNELRLSQLMKRMPNVTQLCLKITEQLPSKHDYLLDFLRENLNLRSIVVKYRDNFEFQDVNFYLELLEIMRNRQSNVQIKYMLCSASAYLNATIERSESGQGNDVTIELKDGKETVIRATKNGIYKRGMLVYWPGSEAHFNHTNIHFLDLAEPPETYENSKQLPFNVILDYLPVRDLFCLCLTSNKCQQLVHNYVKKTYQEDGKVFSILEDGKVYSILNEAVIRTFGPFIRKLDIDVKLYGNRLWDQILYQCGNSLTELTISDYKAYYTTCPTENEIVKIESYGESKPIELETELLLRLHKLKTLKIMADIQFINLNQSQINDVKTLKTIEFFSRNTSIMEFLSCLNYDDERKVTFLHTEEIPQFRITERIPVGGSKLFI